MNSPSLDVIGDLPHWAAVAFGVRCVRRVLPLVHRGLDPSAGDVRIFLFQVRHAETSAGRAEYRPVGPVLLARCAKLAAAVRGAGADRPTAGASIAEASAVLFGASLDAPALDACWAATIRFDGHAPRAQAFLDQLTAEAPASDARECVQRVVQLVLSAARSLDRQTEGQEAERLIVEAMHADLLMLGGDAPRSNEAPVSPSLFPPLWPKPYPSWLGESSDPDQEEQTAVTKATELFNQGLRHSQGGDLERADVCFEQSAAAFDEIVQRFPPRPAYLANAGTACLALADSYTEEKEGREEKALAALSRLRRAVELNELAPAFSVRPSKAIQVANYHHNLGQAIRHLARSAGTASFEPRLLAKAEYERALALDPSHRDALVSLGDPRIGIGRYLEDPLPPPPYEYLLDEQAWSG